MRRLAASTRAVSPVIAVILLLAITIVLASVLYVLLSNVVVVRPGGVAQIGVNYQRTGGNWTITTVTPGLRTGEIEFFTKDPNGVLVIAPLALADFSGFSDQTPFDELNPSDSVAIPVADHPTGSTFAFRDASAVLYEGVLLG